MTLHAFGHVAVPYGSSLTGSSVEERIRPNLRRAFPLPRDEDPRFHELLEALAQEPGTRRPGDRRGP